MPTVLPLTKFVQPIGCASRGRTILSHKGRGRPGTVPQLYLSPCGRGYAGRVNESEPLAEVGEGCHFQPADRNWLFLY